MLFNSVWQIVLYIIGWTIGCLFGCFLIYQLIFVIRKIEDLAGDFKYKTLSNKNIKNNHTDVINY